MWWTPILVQVAPSVASVVGLTVHGSFGSWEFGIRDNSNPRICSYFLRELVRSTTRIATPDSVTLSLLRRHLLTPQGHFQCTGGIGWKKNKK
uniref:Putative secreted protein n=1 Tax=Ixodes ricinus TaxID=34613 RepID=A0A147BNB0_IXORI